MQFRDEWLVCRLIRHNIRVKCPFLSRAATGNRICKLRDVLHRGDRAMIYIFIASSYFPWLSLSPHITSSGFSDRPSTLLSTLVSWIGLSSLAAEDFRWFVWFIAAVGILYQQMFHEKYKWLETLFYVLIGLPSLPSLPYMHQVEIQGIWELKLGGACYIIGLLFFKADGRIPLAHAIWHLHVAMGAAIHYYAIFAYLIG